MKPTVPYIQERYQTFNRQCFGGELPMLPIRLSNAKTFLGVVRYKRKRNLLGKVTYTDFALHISVRYDIDEQELEDTILHEMIHFYILHKRLKDTSAHGVIFRRMMQDINERYGRHIAISHKATQNEHATDKQPKPHFVCVAELEEGVTAVTVCAKTRIFQIYRELPLRYRVRESKWYFTTDSFFNKYPNCLSAKLFRVDRQDLLLHLEGAVELVCDGHTFKPR